SGDAADDRYRVGHGAGKRRQRKAIRSDVTQGIRSLRGRSERRNINRSSGKIAQDCCRIEVSHPAYYWCANRSRKDHRRREQVQLYPLLPQCSKESWTQLEAEAKDK